MTMLVFRRRSASCKRCSCSGEDPYASAAEAVSEMATDTGGSAESTRANFCCLLLQYLIVGGGGFLDSGGHVL